MTRLDPTPRTSQLGAGSMGNQRVCQNHYEFCGWGKLVGAGIETAQTCRDPRKSWQTPTGADSGNRCIPSTRSIIDPNGGLCQPQGGRLSRERRPLREGDLMAERNFANRSLYHGDNLAFLRGMNSGTVNLIATDPPFNKSKDFHATPDSLAAGASFEDRWSWHDDIHDEWLIALMQNEPEAWAVINTAKQVWGDDMGAFLCWLGVRLLEMHRILTDDGSIYLHIDHTAHAWVKALMDAIFGRRNIRNEIVWCYTGPSNTRRWFPRKHDTILYYVKDEGAPFYRDEVRVPYHAETMARRGRGEGSKSIIAASVGTRDDYQDGKVPEDWWADIAALTNQRESTGYPTQKPIALYRRMIEASSNPGDVVLDPFAGCATTCVAAEKAGRQWVGMDTWSGAHQMVLDRLASEKLAVPTPSRARVRESPPPPPRCVTHVRRHHVHHRAACADRRRGGGGAGAANAYRQDAAIPRATHPARAAACRPRRVLSGLRRGLHVRPPRARSGPHQPALTGWHGRVWEPHPTIPALQQRETRPLYAHRATGLQPQGGAHEG